MMESNDKEIILIKDRFIFMITGSLASGKSTIGQKLKEKIKRIAVLEMDELRWQISNFKKGDEDNEIVRKGILALAKNYCLNGINVIIPQTMEKYLGEVDWYKQLAEELNCKYIQVELFASDEIVLKRLLSRKKKNPSSLDRMKRNIEWYKKNKNNDKDILKIDTSYISTEEVFDKIWEYFLKSINMR